MNNNNTKPKIYPPDAFEQIEIAGRIGDPRASYRTRQLGKRCFNVLVHHPNNKITNNFLVDYLNNDDEYLGKKRSPRRESIARTMRLVCSTKINGIPLVYKDGYGHRSNFMAELNGKSPEESEMFWQRFQDEEEKRRRKKRRL